jgi:hypothetical protein
VDPFTSAKSTVTCFRSPSSALREVRIFSARCFGVLAAGIGCWTERTRGDGLAALQTELGSSGQLGVAGGAATSEVRAALEAELGALGILGGGARAAHLGTRHESSSSSAFASFRSGVSNPSVNQP